MLKVNVQSSTPAKVNGLFNSMPGIPPPPPGFQLEGVPPPPPGFQIAGPVPSSSLNGQMDMGSTIGPPSSFGSRMYGQGVHDLQRLNEIIKPQGFEQFLTRPIPNVGQMQPGVNRAIASQITPLNIGLAGTAGPMLKILQEGGIAGKAILALLAAHFASQGASQAGTLAGRASAEPAGGQRREDIANAVLGTVQALLSPAIARAPIGERPIKPSGLGPENVPGIPTINQPNAQFPYNQNKRFVVTPNGTVVDINTLKPGTPDYNALAQPEKKSFGGSLPILQPGVHYIQPETQPGTVLPPGQVEGPKQPIAEAYKSTGEPKQGGQVSFEGQAAAQGVPSARQSAIAPVLPETQRIEYIQQHPIFKQVKEIVDTKDRMKLQLLERQLVTHPDISLAGATAGNLLKITRSRLQELKTGRSDPELQQLRNITSPQSAVKEPTPAATVEVHPPAAGITAPSIKGGEPMTLHSGIPITPEDFDDFVNFIGKKAVELGKVGGFTKQDYSPEDLERYKELKAKSIPQTLEQVKSPEFNENWKQFEQLRNKYGGMPPKQLESESQNASRITSTKGLPEHEVRPRVGEETPLRQQGTVAGARSSGQEPQREGTQQPASEGNESRQENAPQRSPVGNVERGGLSGDVTELHSGVPGLKEFDDITDAFVTQAYKILKDPKFIGFNSGAEVDAQQLRNRLRNKLGENSGEWKDLEAMGIGEVKGKMSSSELANWVKERAPRSEVKVLRSGGNIAGTRFAELQHEADTLGINLERTGNHVNMRRRGGAVIRPEEMNVREAKMYKELNENLLPSEDFQNRSFDPDVYRAIAPKNKDQTVVMVRVPKTTPEQNVFQLSNGNWGTKDLMGRTVELVTKEDALRAAQNQFNQRGNLLHEGHHFGPEDRNVLGWARIQYEDVGGKKVAHIIEVQSDWGQRVREKEQELKNTLQTESASRELQQKRLQGHPLLRDWQRLVLKAAINQARKDSADAIAISDAETAMMTEGHDLAATERHANPDTKLEAIIPQEKGMRLAYDTVLPKIAGELTGEKGESVDFGEHQKAFPREGSWESEGSGHKPRSNLIFRTPSGEPKTIATAKMFSIKKIAERQASGEPMTTSGKMYGGAFVLDPDYWKNVAKSTTETAKDVAGMLGRVKTNADISRAYDAIRGKSAAIANQQSNDVRGPLRRMFGKDLKVAENALSLVREAGDNKRTLKNQLENASELSKSPKWQKQWTAAAQFALDHWAQLQEVSPIYKGLMDKTSERLEDVGRPAEFGPVRHLSESSENDMAEFRRPQEYSTFFDRIKAGSNPRTMNSVDLLKSAIFDSQRSYIQSKAFTQYLTTLKDPATGEPIAVGMDKYEKPSAGRRPIPPSGYQEVPIGGYRVAVMKDYANLLKRLSSTSIFDLRTAGKVIQEGLGLTKHLVYAVDIVHLARIVRREAFAKLGTGHLPLPTYKKGILTLDYSPSELQKMADNGEIDKKDLPDLLERRRINNKLVEGGFNVGRYYDAIRQEWLEKIPITGKLQHFIFQKFTRGAMAEVGPIVYNLYKKDYPNLSDKEIVAKTVKDLNFQFANLGKQGLLKSATGQDIVRMVIMAPQWLESTARYEAQSITGAAKGIATGKFNIQSRTTGTMIAAYLLANQIINYATTGHSTFQNEKDHRLDAWVPTGNGEGYWIAPEAAAMETMYRISQVEGKSESGSEALRDYVDPKLSVPVRAIATAATGHQYGMTGPLVPKDEQLEQAAENLIPVPIGGSSILKPAIDIARGKVLPEERAQLTAQLGRYVGLEGTTTTSDRATMYQAARRWQMKNGIPVSQGDEVESQYLDLNNALRRNDMTAARVAYGELKGKVKDEIIQKYYENYTSKGFTNNKDDEKKFVQSIASDPELSSTYQRAKTSNDEVTKRFFDMIGKPVPVPYHERQEKRNYSRPRYGRFNTR